ncbi:MAG: PEP-CTERM sorting domain-containing protein [Kiritimatiellia bacterium]
MKKLILFLLLISIAHLSSALTLTWTTVLDTNPTGTVVEAGHYGLTILYGAHSTLKASEFEKLITQQETNGNYTINNSADGVAVKIDGDNTYEASSQPVHLTQLFDTLGHTELTFVIFNHWGLTVGEIFTVTIEGLPPDGALSIDLGTLKRPNDYSETHKIITVPEPTVFALLAVAVAASALRRKF